MMGSEKNPGLVRSVSDFIFDFLDRARRKLADRDAPAGKVTSTGSLPFLRPCSLYLLLYFLCLRVALAISR
jgi:hypothetical protein